MKKETTTLIIYVFLALTAFFLLNHHTPRTMDDFNYAFKFTEDGRSNDKITSILEIPKSQYYHYLNYNGRAIVHTIAQLFSIQKTNTLFNILNSLMAVALITLIFVYSKMKTAYTNSTKLWLLVFALFWFLVPSPSMTLMWKTGSLNYLWTSVSIILFLCGHHKVSNGDYSSKRAYPILFLFGVICGWGHEGLSIGLSLGLLAHHIFYRKKFNSSLAVLVLGFWLGTLLVVFSPGILSRADSTILNPSVFTLVTKRLMAIYRMFFEAQTKATLLATLGIVALLFKNRQLLKEFIIKNNLIFLSFVSFLIFQILTAFPGQGRGAIGMELMAIIMIIIFIINTMQKTTKRAYKLIVSLSLFLFTIDYSSALNSCIKNNNSVKHLVSDFNNSTDGIVKSTFPAEFLNDRFIFYLYSSNYNYPQNVAFSKFYNSEKSLVVLGSELFDEVKTGQGLFKETNRINASSDFFTTHHLDCFVSKLNDDVLYEKKTSVLLTYEPEPFSYNTLDRLSKPLMYKVSQHYSGEVEATVLSTEIGIYLIVPKKIIPPQISLKEISI